MYSHTKKNNEFKEKKSLHLRVNLIQNKCFIYSSKTRKVVTVIGEAKSPLEERIRRGTACADEVDL